VNLEDVRAIVQAVDDRSAAQPLLLPGTVASVFGSGRLEVAMDGDPEDTAIEVTGLFADVAPGDRVMVMFDPPRGVYAVGLIGRVQEAGMVVGLSEDVFDEEFTCSGSCTDFLLFPDIQFSGRAGRMYRFGWNIWIYKSDSLVYPDWTLNPSMFGMRTAFYPSGVRGYVDLEPNMVQVMLSYSGVVPYYESAVETITCHLGIATGAADTFRLEGVGQFTITDAGPIDSLTTL
jgi:hypothetical protein